MNISHVAVLSLKAHIGVHTQAHTHLRRMLIVCVSELVNGDKMYFPDLYKGGKYLCLCFLVFFFFLLLAVAP